MTWTILRWLGWRGMVAVVLLAALGVQTARLKYLEARHDKVMRDFGKALTEADIKRRMLEDELAEARKKRPPVAPKIQEVIRANPSGCRVPAPVHDGLQDAVREANAARIGS